MKIVIVQRRDVGVFYIYGENITYDDICPSARGPKLVSNPTIFLKSVSAAEISKPLLNCYEYK